MLLYSDDVWGWHTSFVPPWYIAMMYCEDRRDIASWCIRLIDLDGISSWYAVATHQDDMSWWSSVMTDVDTPIRYITTLYYDEAFSLRVVRTYHHDMSSGSRQFIIVIYHHVTSSWHITMIYHGVILFWYIVMISHHDISSRYHDDMCSWIVLSFAPSAAAVWHCERGKITCESNSVRHDVFFKRWAGQFVIWRFVYGGFF